MKRFSPWGQRILWTIVLWSASFVAAGFIGGALRIYGESFRFGWRITETYILNAPPLW
jgi:hypothetical protein